MKWFGACLTAGVFASACMTPPADTPEPATTPPPTTDRSAGERDVKTEQDLLGRVDDTCGLDAMKPYLGKQAVDIPANDLPEDARILSPNSSATMDYLAGRLNILTDEDGRVIGLNCG